MPEVREEYQGLIGQPHYCVVPGSQLAEDSDMNKNKNTLIPSVLPFIL